MIYITGDTHGDFSRFEGFCKRNQTSKNDVMIVLGDAGLNGQGWLKDKINKMIVEQLPISFFFVRGNHEARPETMPECEMRLWCGGQVYVDPEFPSLNFAKDGEIYDIGGLKTIVIGGAYSIDKQIRLAMEPVWGKTWWEDEQLAEDEMDAITATLEKLNWKIDAVLSHTAPLKYEPVELFLPGVNQNEVDKTMERWLGWIEEKLEYRHWWFGHYHGEKDVDKTTMLFQSIRPWSEQT